MKATKQEVIRYAYGKNWTKFDNKQQESILKNNGFMFFSRYEESMTPSDMFGEDNIEKTFDYSLEMAGQRPISLKDLENNNGWSILLPEESPEVKEGISYDLYDAEEDRIYYGIQGIYTVLTFTMLPAITHIRVSRNDKPLYKCEQ